MIIKVIDKIVSAGTDKLREVRDQLEEKIESEKSKMTNESNPPKMSDFEDIFSGISNYGVRQSQFQKQIGSWLHEYFVASSEIESMCEKFFNGNREDKELEALIRSRKQEVFERYWSNQSDFYKPRGLSSVKRHEWEKVSEIEAIQNHDDENRLIICRYVYDGDSYAFLLKDVKGQLFIEHGFD